MVFPKPISSAMIQRPFLDTANLNKNKNILSIIYFLLHLAEVYKHFIGEIQLMKYNSLYSSIYNIVY